ncbi:MAG: hypothetical protein QM498_06030 [Desulfobacterium sp.]
MIIYDGIYKWDGKQRNGQTPVCWWPGEYRIRIIRLNSENPGIHFLKGHAVLCRNMGKGTSIRNYAQNFARLISEEFNLPMEKTLWIELLEYPPGDIQVATLNRVGALSSKPLYTASWRPILPNEKNLIAPYMEGFESELPNPAD